MPCHGSTNVYIMCLTHWFLLRLWAWYKKMRPVWMHDWYWEECVHTARLPQTGLMHHKGVHIHHRNDDSFVVCVFVRVHWRQHWYWLFVCVLLPLNCSQDSRGASLRESTNAVSRWHNCRKASLISILLSTSACNPTAVSACACKRYRPAKWCGY